MPSTNGRAGTARRRLIRTGLLLTLAFLLAACSGEQSVLNPQGPFAEKPDDLFRWVFWIAVVVFILVQGLIVYTAVKFRRREGDDALPVQTHGNTRLEILWTIIPAVILAAIAVPTVQQIFDLSEEPDGALTVEVIGHRWWWEYRYPDHGIITANELVIPVDRPVRLEMRSEENGRADRGVIHSYWIPALAGKQDVSPARVSTLNIHAEEPGRFYGMCTEYCGLSHANMRNRAVVLEQDDFVQWVQDQQAPAVEPEEGTLAAEGARLFHGGEDTEQLACASCHSIRREPVTAADGFSPAVGPDLTHLMSRKEFAGAIYDLYERAGDEGSTTEPDDEKFTDEPNVDLLKQWLADPPAMKAMRPEEGIGMPDLNLTQEEIDALVAYLITLE